MMNSVESKPAPTGEALSANAREFVYKPISGMAVFCFLASVLALTSFLNYSMILLAGVVLVLSIITSISLDRARNEYAGQLLAKGAVLLGLVGTVGAATKHTVTYYALSAEAREFAEQYLLALVNDDLEEAFRLRVGPEVRASCNNDVKEILLRYNKNFDGFKKELVTQSLRAGGAQSTITYTGATEFFAYEGRDLIGIHFRVQLATGDRKEYELTLGIAGGVSEQGDWEGRQWYIHGNDTIREVSKVADDQTAEQ